MTTTSHISTSNPYQARTELLERGCPVCGAKARQVRVRRTHELWRIHCACRSRFVGFGGREGSVEVEQRCRHALFSNLTEQRLELMIRTASRRVQA